MDVTCLILPNTLITQQKIYAVLMQKEIHFLEREKWNIYHQYLKSFKLLFKKSLRLLRLSKNAKHNFTVFVFKKGPLITEINL